MTATPTPAQRVTQAFKKAWELDALAAIEEAAPGVPPKEAFDLGEAARKKKWFNCGEILLCVAAGSPALRQTALPSLVECRVSLGLWKEAEAAANDLLAKDPRNRRMLRAKARIVWKLGRPDEAIGLLRTYSSIAKSWSEPWLEMARVHAATGNWREAARTAAEAMKRGEEGEEILTIMIDGLFAVRNFGPARDHIVALARRQPCLIARWVRMRIGFGEPLAAAHLCAGLISARGTATDVGKTVWLLRAYCHSAAASAARDTSAALHLLDEAWPTPRTA